MPDRPVQRATHSATKCPPDFGAWQAAGAAVGIIALLLTGWLTGVGVIPGFVIGVLVMAWHRGVEDAARAWEDTE